MHNKEVHLNRLKFHQRLLHLLQCFLLLVALVLMLLYGTIMTTNIMTQLSHTESWLYVLVFISCYLIIAFGIGMLYKLMAKHMILARTGFKPVK